MRTSIARPALAAICLITSLVAAPVKAQTREQGPWWPHSIWGKDDLHFEELLAERAYEFLFVFTPVRFKGATGSPGRPLAIR
jgi:kynurenine formamidase